jgi:hypothetical protein
MSEGIDQHDQRQLYCRRLGHHLGFGYCRTASDGRPCGLILDCWFETFDVASFMEEQYSREEIAAATAPPRAKMVTLVELIEKARASATTDKNQE